MMMMNAKLRIDLHQEMNVIRHDFQFKDVCPVLRRHFADQFFAPFSGAIQQDFTPLFWTLDDMIFARVEDVSIRFVVHRYSIPYIYCILNEKHRETEIRAKSKSKDKGTALTPWLKPGACGRVLVMERRMHGMSATLKTARCRSP